MIAKEKSSIMVCGRTTNPIHPALDGRLLTNRTEFFFITAFGFDRMESLFLPQWLHKLHRIVTGYHCFERARLCEISGLSELEILEFGDKNFSCYKERVWNDMSLDGCLRIVNCPKLQSIRVGEYSFSDYHSLELRNLPSLQSIQMEEWSFYEAPLFSLVGLIAMSN